jgi:integrase
LVSCLKPAATARMGRGIVLGRLGRPRPIARQKGELKGELKVQRSHTLHRLSAVFVRRCKTPGVYLDGGGLRLRVMPNGSRIWVMRLTVGGKSQDFSLGPLAKTSLADARSQAAEIRQAVADGRNPAAERQVAAANARRPATRPALEARRPTFRDCRRAYWAVKEPQLSNPKHRDQWTMTTRVYALPHIGHRPVADVRPSEIIDVLKPIWHAKEETARRVLQRINAVFVSAMTRELRDKANPCAGVASELGRRRRKPAHHAALAYADVPAFVRDLRNRKGSLESRLALEFLILTATRSGETRWASWDEIDLVTRCWTIPPHRMKARTEHVVPLSSRAIGILMQVQGERNNSSLCFPNLEGGPFSDMAFTKAIRDMGLSGHATAHGFRTAFKVWAAEGGVRDEVSEAALAHTDPNEVRAAYRRTNFLDERRTIMQHWSDFVCGLVQPQATLIGCSHVTDPSAAVRYHTTRQ